MLSEIILYASESIYFITDNSYRLKQLAIFS